MRNKLVSLGLCLYASAALAGNINNIKLVKSNILADKSANFHAVELACDSINKTLGSEYLTPIREDVDYTISGDLNGFLNWYTQNNDGIIPLYHGTGVANVPLAAAARSKNVQHCRVTLRSVEIDKLATESQALVIAHELGHCLGLDHSESGMLSGMSANSILPFVEDDKEALYRLYDANNNNKYGSVRFNGSLVLLKRGFKLYASNDGNMRVKPGTYAAILDGADIGKIKIKSNKVHIINVKSSVEKGII